jgi:20S proteasome alpha/beta subunit
MFSPISHKQPPPFLTRNVQVEYAVKAVENGGTAIGIRCKDGVVLALEKLVTSKLLKPSANKRIATVDRNIGVVRTQRLLQMNGFGRKKIC